MVRHIEATSDALARIRYGTDSEPCPAAMGVAARIPIRHLPPGPSEEVWPASGWVERVAIEDAQAAADGRFLFVALEAVAGSDNAIEPRAFELYQRLLRGVERAGYPHVVRIWNYVPRIHGRVSAVDRYMLFCKGRSEAFADHYGDGFAARLCAASAVGCPGETLVMHALASREAVRHVENPRQLSAYRYPERYGPKSPSFARGTVVLGGLGGRLFVSGTASIVGHESTFPGDPVGQTAETLRNIAAVLDAAGVPGPGDSLGSRLESLRVYLRFPAQLEAIREAIATSTESPVATAWLQAEICREELLVEIEATAQIPGESWRSGDPDLRERPVPRKD